MSKQDLNILELIALLEISESSLGFLKVDYQTAVLGLPKFKDIVRKQRRLLTKKHHPDLMGGDSELMKNINAATDLLLKIEIQQPKPQPRVIIVQFGGGFASSTATTMF